MMGAPQFPEFQLKLKMRIVQHPLDVIDTQREIRYPKYSTLASRLESFTNKSNYEYFKKNKQVLAEAGFYSTGYIDCTVCYYCGGDIRSWSEGDDPWTLHSIYFTCPYVDLMKDHYVDNCSRSTKTLPESRSDLSMDFEDENTIKEDDDSSKCAICLTGKREILFSHANTLELV